MSKIIKIGITENNNKNINEVNAIDLVAGKGIIGDRHFKDYNDPYNHYLLLRVKVLMNITKNII